MTKKPNQFTRHWQDIKNEQDAMKAIKLAVELADEAISDSIEDRDTLRTNIDRLLKTICGNDDPTHSIIARVIEIEKQIDKFSAELKDITLLLKGGLTIEKNSICDKLDCLDERMKTLEKTVDKSNGNLNKVTWILVTALLGAIAMAIINLL